MAKTKRKAKVYNWHFWNTKRKVQVVIDATSYMGARKHLRLAFGKMADEFVFEFGDEI